MRAANPPPESRYEVLALFTVAMLGASLFLMATGALMPFFERSFHIGQTQIGLVLSAQMIGSMLMTAFAGMLTDRFGDKAVVLWSGCFMGFTLVLASLVPNFTWLLIWLMLYGIGYAAVTPAGSHAIIYFFKKEDRGFAMGLRQCGVPLAGVIGSLLLPAIALHFEYQWALAAAGVITAIAGVLASMLYREPKELEGERVSMRAMLVEMLTISRDARLILLTLTGMVLIAAQVAVMAFLAVTFVHEAAYAVPLAIGLFTLSQAAAIAGRLAWGWSSDHLFKGSRAVPLALACAVTAGVALGTSFITPATSLAVVALLAALLGFTAEGWLGVGVIALAEIGGEEHSGSALGVSLTWIFAAAFVAPAIFGALAEAHGFPFAWRAIALLALAGVIPAMLASYVIRRFIATTPANPA